MKPKTPHPGRSEPLRCSICFALVPLSISWVVVPLPTGLRDSVLSEQRDGRGKIIPLGTRNFPPSLPADQRAQIKPGAPYRSASLTCRREAARRWTAAPPQGFLSQKAGRGGVAAAGAGLGGLVTPTEPRGSAPPPPTSLRLRPKTRGRLGGSGGVVVGTLASYLLCCSRVISGVCSCARHLSLPAFPVPNPQ